MYFLLLLNFIVSLVMIFVGGLLKRHPVADMKSHNGYNTPTSRKSQGHWDYAQNIAPDNFIFLGKTLGVIEIIFGIAVFLLQISVYAALIVGNCVGFGFLFFAFYKTDADIAKKFEEG